MSEPFDQTENDLVALLDEALAAFKGDRAFDFEAWRQCHGRELAEAPALLATLRQLAESTHGWKQLLLPGRPSEDTASYCRNGPPVRPAPANIGRYYILGELGSGGMGVVYKAHDPQLDRVVAVKVPNLQHAKTEPAVTLQRFLREARAAAAVRHPHICPIYDVGEQASVPYVVMAYVRGGSLAQCLRRGRFQDVRQAVALARQVAEALVVIHGQGIIHRDLKPGNILLDDRGEALITDFGLSRLVEDRDHLTRSGMILGTPAYMAPEAVVEGCAGPATDVYSLGAVLYQMLTGVPPCEEGSQALLNAALAPEVPPPSRLRAEVDPALEAVILRAMAREPAQRFDSAQALLEALTAWLDEHADPPRPSEAGLQRRRAEVSGPRAKHRVLAWFAGVCAAGLLLAALLVHALSRPRADSDARPSVDASRTETPPAPLTGDLFVSLYTDEKLIEPGLLNRGLVKAKKGIRVDQEGALPVHNYDAVHIYVRLNQEAYVYLLWLGSEGDVAPLYPWRFPKEGFGTPLPTAVKVTELHSPANVHEGWEMEGKSGLETVLLLAGHKPVESGTALEKLIGRFDPAPLGEERELALLELLPGTKRVQQPVSQFRGLSGRAKTLDEPLFALLEQQLRPHFDLIKAVRFARVER